MDLASALQVTDDRIQHYLTREVLDVMDPPVRHLLVLTSVVDPVPPGILRAVLGPDSREAVDQTMAATGLVQRLPDGAVSCHPLLRSAARAQLGREHPLEARLPRERVVGWLADNGAVDAAVELSVVAQEWRDAAEVLVQANIVPQLVAGIADEGLRGTAERPEVQVAEPLIRASVAVARGDLLGAESALAVSSAHPELSTSAHALGVDFVLLGTARMSGRPLDDVALAQRARRQLAHADPSTAETVAKLSVVLDAYSGAVDLMAGRVEQAAVALKRGADDRPIASRSSSADCAGQLALLEAYRGNLTEATRRATAAFSIGTGEGHSGVAHAHVAIAWVHVERGELSEAEGRLARAAMSLPEVLEPWPHLAVLMVKARLLIASGRADEALRLTASWSPSADDGGGSVWLKEQVTALSAEALWASGEPQEALALATSGLAAGSPERAVLTALARRDIGDLRGASAAILSSAGDLRSAPRATQVQGWLLEARLAHERGQLDRAVLLVERALRAASSEHLRRPLAGSAAWLRWFLDRDGTILRDHRPFVSTLVAVAPETPRATATTFTSNQVLEPLTERETQVLELLAQMCSTDEIANELFVSANTVKTHLKGIFRKYGVNRRVDAVRRGRELGLC
jgi:LuxR family maltose regulon positive regulatory protein